MLVRVRCAKCTLLAGRPGVCFMNIASDTCVWTGGSPFESNPSFLLSPTFVNQGLTCLLFPPTLFWVKGVQHGKGEVAKFLQVPLHKGWSGWCSALLGPVTLIPQGLRPAELPRG